MAWKTLKLDPTKEKLDDSVYKFRRVAKELGYNADENLDVFSCCVPFYLYLYLRGATTVKEAMENIKRACTLGGVSVQATPAPTETKTTPAVSFMQLNERQNLKTVSFKDDIVKEVKDSIEMNDIKPILEKLTQVMEKTQQVAEKKDLIVEIEIVEPEVETRTQERRGKIQAPDIPQVCSVIIVK